MNLTLMFQWQNPTSIFASSKMSMLTAGPAEAEQQPLPVSASIDVIFHKYTARVLSTGKPG